MQDNNSNSNKDVANSLSKYSDMNKNGVNILLDGASQINKWYEEQLNKMTDSNNNSRLSTNTDNTIESIVENEKNIINTSKIETKIEQYNEVKTNEKRKSKNIKYLTNIQTQTTDYIESTNEENIQYAEDLQYAEDKNIIDGSLDTNLNSNKVLNNPRIKTLVNNNQEIIENSEVIINENNFATNNVKQNSKVPKRIATTIKGAKILNNTTNKIMRVGKNINTGLNDGEYKSFEQTSSRIMTKPIKVATNKVTQKATNKILKSNKTLTKKAKKNIVKTVTNVMNKVVRTFMKIIESALKLILSMLPSIAPVIIILVVMICFLTYFGTGMSNDTRNKYEQYMISIQDQYDNETVSFYNEGNIVDGTINGKGFINWRAPMAIIQMLNGNLDFDSTEVELLNTFKNADLYEKVVTETYTEERQVEVVDKKGNVTTKTETITKTKKIVTNPTLNDYITWCSNNFGVINSYKSRKGLDIKANQTAFTESEIEQIKLLYNSTAFFELFSQDFQTRYAYQAVSIGDAQLQAIYDEFLRNAGKRYLMDHSNLSYDTCMDYYDCSSWTIHCLAHAGVKVIPNTTASGIYSSYCMPINPSDRQGGDLIFLKDTYNTGVPGGISHVGIYMGVFTINGETDEWIIDTGGNPSGVKLSKYNNGWWNGSHFYGFGRLR